MDGKQGIDKRWPLCQQLTKKYWYHIYDNSNVPGNQ